MFRKLFVASLLAALLLIAPVIALAQGGAQKRTLIINGKSTQAPLIEVNGHPYVGLEELANAIKGSLSSSGKMLALSYTVATTNASPCISAPASPTPPAQTQPVEAPPTPAFSKQFLNAGIEEMSTLREWHAALAYAIENGVPLSEALFAPYRARATTNLAFAKVAAATPSDNSAYQLLNKAFQKMAKLSDKYIAQRASLRYLSPNSLENDDLNQSIIACGSSLRSMAANGQFVNDGSCE